MAQYPLLIFVIFLEIFNNVYCENGNKLHKRVELKNVDHSEDKGLLFDQNGASSEAKIVEKRRLLFNVDDVNSPVSPVSTEGEFEINEPSSKRRTNFTETQTQFTEYQKGYKNWKNKQNKFSFPTESENSRNPLQFRLRQPSVGLSNQNFNWGQSSETFDARQSQWNEGKNFHQQVANPEFFSRVDHNYSGRVPQILNHGDNTNGNIYQGRNGDFFNRKVSMTTLTDKEMLNEKNYNGERLGEINPGYVGASNTNHYSRNSKGFWDANLHRPEKGVIINFNTECPTPRQFSNHMVHKFIFTPKSPIGIQPEIPHFQLPETPLISGQQMPPMYYL